MTPGGLGLEPGIARVGVSVGQGAGVCGKRLGWGTWGTPATSRASFL